MWALVRYHDGTEDQTASVDWDEVFLPTRTQRDYQRVTEDGAEGVALALVHEAR